MNRCFLRYPPPEYSSLQALAGVASMECHTATTEQCQGGNCSVLSKEEEKRLEYEWPFTGLLEDRENWNFDFLTRQELTRIWYDVLMTSSDRW